MTSAKSVPQASITGNVPARLDLIESVTFDRLIRLPEVLQLVPVSRSTWFSGVRSGRYPAPVRIGVRAVAWRHRDIRRLVEKGISIPK
jgi:predicted DNA-binding transcriptional regulator AlpA